jgi:hypothetical protein
MPASSTTNLSDVFLGSEQSKYAGVALFITILIICLSILFTSSKIPIEQRIVFVIFIIIITIPSILMSLFELTCIVTGGNYNTRWWCWALAWVLAIMIIFYCIMIIISLFISMTTYDLANERISDDLEKNKIDNTTDNTNANNYAKNIMSSSEEHENVMHTSQTHQRPVPPMPQQRPTPPTPPTPPMSQQLQEPPMHEQYQPPVPPQTQTPFPQQSQYMNFNQSLPVSQTNGEYTGFDTTDNLSPLDSAFNNTIKAPVRSSPAVNSAPKMNDNVSPYTDSNVDKFSLF